MTNFPCAKKEIGLENKEVVIYDLSLGFIIGFEAKTIDDSFLNVLLDATNLSEEEITKLRRSEAEFLVKEIMSLTYGEEKKGKQDGDGKK